MMREADPDGSGEIDFEEFVAVLQKQMGEGGAFAEVVESAFSLYGLLSTRRPQATVSSSPRASRASAARRGLPRS